MNICEAVKQAMKSGKRITRQGADFLECQIEPTDGPSCCIIHHEGLRPGVRWNPTASDLVADDGREGE